tara:strand:+ start:142 stop:912 length:771 start_codon:yes stop_codon:yes gene_type:complete
LASTSTNKQPMMLDRPASTSTLVRTQTGQLFSTSLLPTSIGNVTKVFDVDQSLTDTQISGAYIDEIYLRYTKDVNVFIDAVNPFAATYTRTALALTVTLNNHDVKVGDKVYLDITSGSATDEVLTVTEVTSSTFKGNHSVSGTTNGNVNVYLPTDFVFYLTDVSTVTGTTQFLPLFTAHVQSIPEDQSFSLSERLILPFINSPVAHAGTNFTSANSTFAPKLRGLMLPRGSALHVGISGIGSLTNGFYVNVQGGYY